MHSSKCYGADFDGIDAIGGLTMGGDPVAYGVQAVAANSWARNCAASVFAKKPSRAASPVVLPARCSQVTRVLVTEDTTTRGTSLIEAAEEIEAFGAIAVFMTVIVDRGGTCAAMAADKDIDYRPLLTAPDLGFGFGT